MSFERKLLDHGYIKLVERWGSEELVIESARMSTGKGFLGWGPFWKCSSPTCSWTSVGGEMAELREMPPPGYQRALPCPKCATLGIVSVAGDEKLLRRLWEHKHSTPFEMGGLTIEAQAPIFVFREWHRHRVPFGYSELSARYTPLPKENYLPTLERCMVGSDGKNKQAGTIAGAAVLTEDAAQVWRAKVAKFYDEAQELYDFGLNAGIPKELARIVVPVGRYTRHRATGNLRGWLAFLALRFKPDAQYEIRVYAESIATIIQQEFPQVWALWSEGQ